MELYIDCYFVSLCDGEHRDLHVVTHSFPTRRSSDLAFIRALGQAAQAPGRVYFTGGASAVVWTRFSAPSRRSKNRSSSMSNSPRPMISRSEEHTSELQSLMRISYAVFCLNKKKNTKSTIKYHLHK